MIPTLLDQPITPPADAAPPAEPPPLADVPVWLCAEFRPDREVATWCYFNPGRQLVIVVNRAHPRIVKALRAHDAEAFAFLVALPLAELLITRQRDPWIGACLQRLRRVLVEPDKQAVRGVLFLAEKVAGSAPFQVIAKDICGKAKLPEARRQITAIRLTGA